MNEFPQGSDRLALLQTFVSIVEAGSLSAAAARLQSSQPTVSRRLQALERTLGLRLLQRSTHAMKLTPDGERCYAHAKELLDSWQSIEADMRGIKDQPHGTLRVLAPHAFGQDQLVTPVAQFLHRYPGVAIEWILHDRLPDFIADGIDCAIRVGKVEDPGVVALPLAEVPRIVVAAPGVCGAGPLPQHPAQLQTLPWLALQTFYRNEVVLSRVADGKKHRHSIQPRFSTDSLHALRNALLAGLGAAIASSWVVSDDLAQGRLIHLAPQWQAASLPVYLVYPYARFYPARLRAFIEQIRAHIPRITGMTPPAS